MPKYIDSFVVAVPVANLVAYKKMSRTIGKIWRDHGALEYIEWIADDVKPGKWTSYPQSVKLKEGETVLVAWIVYTSRAHRDRVSKASMADPRMQKLMSVPMPFDGKRMIMGGFKHWLEV